MINTKEPKDNLETYLEYYVQEAQGRMSNEELIDLIEKLEHLESLCQSHDWYYAYSDDHRAWTRGTRERDSIALHSALLREQGHGDAVDKIIAKYCN